MVQFDWFDFTHFLIGVFGILTKNSFKILIVLDMRKVPPLQLNFNRCIRDFHFSTASVKYSFVGGWDLVVLSVMLT